MRSFAVFFEQILVKCFIYESRYAIDFSSAKARAGDMMYAIEMLFAKQTCGSISADIDTAMACAFRGALQAIRAAASRQGFAR